MKRYNAKAIQKQVTKFIISKYDKNILLNLKFSKNSCKLFFTQ